MPRAALALALACAGALALVALCRPGAPGAAPGAPGDEAPAAVVATRRGVRLATALGDVVVWLRCDWSPASCDAVLRAAQRPCPQCSLYRAEPVPPHWGPVDAAWARGGRGGGDPPGTVPGAFYGPPWALIQGRLPLGGKLALGPARDAVRKGTVAWAGGLSGPDFFVALADHPEWGTGHHAWGQVDASSLAVLEQLLHLPATTQPGNPPVRYLDNAVPFAPHEETLWE